MRKRPAGAETTPAAGRPSLRPRYGHSPGGACSSVRSGYWTPAQSSMAGVTSAGHTTMKKRPAMAATPVRGPFLRSRSGTPISRGPRGCGRASDADSVVNELLKGLGRSPLQSHQCSGDEHQRKADVDAQLRESLARAEAFREAAEVAKAAVEARVVEAEAKAQEAQRREAKAAERASRAEGSLEILQKQAAKASAAADKASAAEERAARAEATAQAMKELQCSVPALVQSVIAAVMQSRRSRTPVCRVKVEEETPSNGQRPMLELADTSQSNQAKELLSVSLAEAPTDGNSNAALDALLNFYSTASSEAQASLPSRRHSEGSVGRPGSQ